MIGQTISHYRILEKLGGGGMGVVYKAEDTKLQRLVALKFLPPEIGADQTAKDRFMHEARTASALQHNNICTIHEIDETDDGRLFICMDYYEGHTLRDILANGPLGIDETVNIVLQIADGLAKAHEKEIVHRDVKPANIMITHDGVVKILDFGLAKLAGQARFTRTGSTVGTVAYMSPEQAQGKETDGRSDMFSLGVVTYELLAGRLPFKGEHETAMLYSIIHNEAEPIDRHRQDVPDILKTVIEKALKKEPSERYGSVVELTRDLEPLVAASGTQVRGKAPVLPGGAAAVRQLKRKSTWNRLKPFLYGSAVVVLLVIVVSVYWANRRGTREPSETAAERAVVEREVPKQVTLRQITFSEGVEEFPALSPDGSKLAYCAEVGRYRQVFVKDLETGQMRQVTNTTADNIQPGWSPDSRTIVFIRSHLPDGKLAPDVVFGIYGGGDVWMLTLASGEEMKIIDNAFNPAFSPDGKHLAFDASLAGPRRIWVADYLGRNPQQVSYDPSEVVRHHVPRWSPDGSKIVFQNKDWTRFDIKIVDVATRQMISVTDDLSQDLNPVWSSSGSAILFSSYRSGGLNVWRMPVSSDGHATGPPQQVTTGAGQDVQLASCTESNRLAMSILKLNADLWRMPVDPQTGEPMGEPEPLVATTREDSRGAWAPDGRRVAFNSDRTGDMNIFVHSIDDGSVTQVTKGPGGDYQPTWSPDGTKLVFFSSRSGNADIWAVDIETGEMNQLTKRPSLEINPFYSPDGTHIAYQSDHEGRRELWVMNTDGTEDRQLTRIGVSGHFMLWAPESDAVIIRSLIGDDVRFRRVPIAGGEPEPFPTIAGGAHMSFSPTRDKIMDIVGHRVIWVSPLTPAELEHSGPKQVFEFENPDVRIDYPVWSPDGKWVLFDRVKPEGGDIWLIESYD
ncbi:MAG: PD40 domain-containing protein [Candidatus Latescibacterota bacterium]|nr:MAG: PD40 domain-containing protein [Candidatus Latescibacterota bacterium]